MDCNYNKILQIFLWKSYTKDRNGPLRPGTSSCIIQTNDIFIRKCLKYRVYGIRATFLNLVLKGHHTWLHWIDDRDTVRITGSKRPVSVLCASLVPELLKNAFLFAVNKNQVSISMIQVFSIQDLFMPNDSDLLTKTNFWIINRSIAQIPQCTKPISNNAPFCNRNMLENGALWVICLMRCGTCEMDDLFIILLFSDF